MGYTGRKIHDLQVLQADDTGNFFYYLYDRLRCYILNLFIRTYKLVYDIPYHLMLLNSSQKLRLWFRIFLIDIIYNALVLYRISHPVLIPFVSKRSFIYRESRFCSLGITFIIMCYYLTVTVIENTKHKYEEYEAIQNTDYDENGESEEMNEDSENHENSGDNEDSFNGFDYMGYTDSNEDSNESQQAVKPNIDDFKPNTTNIRPMDFSSINLIDMENVKQYQEPKIAKKESILKPELIDLFHDDSNISNIDVEEFDNDIEIEYGNNENDNTKDIKLGKITFNNDIKVEQAVKQDVFGDILSSHNVIKNERVVVSKKLQDDEDIKKIFNPPTFNEVELEDILSKYEK